MDLRGFGRRRRRRGQGRGLPQLARPDEGHARRRASTRAARRSSAALNPDRVYTAPDGGDADAARPQPDAGAQCRPPDDDRRGARRATASRVAGRHPRCRRHLADRAARPARATAPLRNSRAGSVYIVKPKMHGPGGGRLRRRAVRPRRGRARPAAQHAQDGHHGRGAAHHRQPQGLHPRGAATASCFINTGFLDRTGDEIHTSMEAGADDPQGRHAQQPPGSRPTRTGTSTSGSPAACRAARRSARACGRCPTGWPTCWRRRSRIRRPAPTPPGCPRRPRRRCTRCTITRSTWPRARRSCARAPRASLDDILTIPRRRPRQLDAGGGPAGARQQRAGHPRLRRALDRPGRRLLEGARHPRCRPDGGPRDAAHLQPAHRQLAAPRRRQRGAGDGDAAAHGGGGRPAERRRSALPADGAGLRRPSPSRRPATWSSRAARSRTATPSRSCTRAGARRRRRG